MFRGIYDYSKFPRFVATQSIRNKYQLSLIDPRDRTVLWTELDDHCDKLVVERRSSEALST